MYQSLRAIYQNKNLIMVSSIGQLFDFVNKLQFKVFEEFRIKEHSVLVFL
jgi:hypothetical protein